jgi:hypothetical protein
MPEIEGNAIVFGLLHRNAFKVQNEGVDIRRKHHIHHATRERVEPGTERAAYRELKKLLKLVAKAPALPRTAHGKKTEA